MIVITGASKNVGRYLFTRFKEAGEEVIGIYNSTRTGFENDADCYYQVDISDCNNVEQWIEEVRPQLKRIVLINCAGISYNGFAHKSDLEKWIKVIEVNLIGTFTIIRSLLPIMREEGYGRIINFSSVVAKKPTAGVSAYAASKAGLIGLTKSLAAENAAKGVTVNAINLGYSNIGMGLKEVPQKFKEELMNTIPTGRFCEPKEIFNTVKYLIDTEYVNGADININGCLI